MAFKHEINRMLPLNEPYQLALPVALPPPDLRFPPRPARFAFRLARHASQNQRPSGGTVSPIHARWN
jgi:hypothetical protein